MRDAFRIFADEGYHALALSGGRSRPHLADRVSNSEAEGMLEYARRSGLPCDPDAILLERYGRDSFENLFFSMLCLPPAIRRVAVARGRRQLEVQSAALLSDRMWIATGRRTLPLLRQRRSRGQPAIEAFAAASVQYDAMIVRGGEIVDPLHRDAEWFAAKRMGRTPREFPNNEAYLAEVKKVYGNADLIDQVESVQPGPGWRDIRWPWL